MEDELIQVMEKLIQAQKEAIEYSEIVIKRQDEMILIQKRMIENFERIKSIDDILLERRKYGTDF